MVIFAFLCITSIFDYLNQLRKFDTHCKWSKPRLNTHSHRSVDGSNKQTREAFADQNKIYASSSIRLLRMDNK